MFKLDVNCNKINKTCTLNVYEVKNKINSNVLQCEGVIGINGIEKEKDGDLKTPIGIFKIQETAYGIKERPSKCKFNKYIQIKNGMIWRCDPTKPDYNTFKMKKDLPKGWTNKYDEDLFKYGKVYNYFLDIGYNLEKIPYKGSAIFLHCWKNNTTPTHGCIAIAESNMKKILQTIDPKNSYIIIH